MVARNRGVPQLDPFTIVFVKMIGDRLPSQIKCNGCGNDMMPMQVEDDREFALRPGAMNWACWFCMRWVRVGRSCGKCRGAGIVTLDGGEVRCDQCLGSGITPP